MPVIWWVPLVLGVWGLGLWLHASRERGVRLRGLPIWTADLQPLGGLDLAPDVHVLPDGVRKIDGVKAIRDDDRTWWVRYRVRDTYVVGRHVRLANDCVESEYFAMRRYLPYGALLVATGAMGGAVLAHLAGAPGFGPAVLGTMAGQGVLFAAMRVLRGRVPTAAEARLRVVDAHARLAGRSTTNLPDAHPLAPS